MAVDFCILVEISPDVSEWIGTDGVIRIFLMSFII